MNIIKSKAISFIENTLSKNGHVLKVRSWDSKALYEVDLFLPYTNMNRWTMAQHMKCKVDNYTYRDYTPALWDASSNKCTLFVDASHKGAGSLWVSKLKSGDIVTYVGVGPTTHTPSSGKMIFIGDFSSVGHFLALKQLTSNESNIKGAIVVGNNKHHQNISYYFEKSVNSIILNRSQNYNSVIEWLDNQSLNEETIFVAGNNSLCIQVRKYVRQKEQFKGKVKVTGFWS